MKSVNGKNKLCNDFSKAIWYPVLDKISEQYAYEVLYNVHSHLNNKVSIQVRASLQNQVLWDVTDFIE